MQTVIALDLETTGLDAEQDAIIEIGAVRFRGARVEDEWSALVNPGRPLPPFITQLTGIDDAMLANAPRLSAVLPELAGFVGELPVLGHNVRFDLGFLRPRGLLRYNLALDTYDLASVVMPSASRYRLEALASELGILTQVHHRALEDARTTQRVFVRLAQMVRELPLEVVAEIVRLGAEIEWGAGWVFEEALQDLQKTGTTKPAAKKRRPRRPAAPASVAAPFSPAAEPFVPTNGIRRAAPGGAAAEPAGSPDPARLVRRAKEVGAEPQPLDDEALAGALQPGGSFARAFPAYEHRSQQVAMLQAIARALSQGRHLLVEAGTGTGKSMAYLIPAFAWAALNGERVVVSTNTLNLQDQLIHKDIPDLRRTLGGDYRAAVLKGRANYLCPRRLAPMRRLGPRTAEEMRVMAKILVWLERGGTGERSEINIMGPAETLVWSRLSAEDEDCSPEKCLEQTGGACPYYRARQDAEVAHVIIVNHALLLADIVTGNRVIPEYNYLIVDEAHHLEVATTNGLSFHVTEAELTRQLRDLGSREEGQLTRAIQVIQAELPAEHIASIARDVDQARDRNKECLDQTARLFTAVGAFLARRREDQSLGRYGQQERVIPGTRSLPDWSEVEVAWDNLRLPLTTLLQKLSAIAENLASLHEAGFEAAEDLLLAIRGSGRSLGEVLTNLDRMIFEPDPQWIHWIELQGVPPRISLHAAPLDVGPLVERYLWHEKSAVIMTSATLTTAGQFDYLKRRLKAEEAEELLLGSPFDFESATLLYLVNDITEPSDRANYQREFEQALLRLCKATRGRALVLFTSHEQLQRTARAIGEPLAAQGISVFEQGEGASRHALLETFRTSEQAVLLGTRSFWEGVDVPGEALSILAIARLPFDVPTDPIVAARSETYESPFEQYSVPEAILRFRQGFGRLIRTRSDRGVVAVFDRRILSKRYGRAFIESLPRCTVRIGTMNDLPTAARRWIGD